MSEEFVDFQFSKGTLESSVTCPECKIPLQDTGSIFASFHMVEGEYIRVWYFEDRKPASCCGKDYAIPLSFESDQVFLEFYYEFMDWLAANIDQNVFESVEFPLEEMLYDADSEVLKACPRLLG